MSDESAKSGTGDERTTSIPETANQPAGKGEDTAPDQSIPETILHILGLLGEESIPVLVSTGLDALFSDAVRDRVEQAAAQGLRDLIESAQDALANSTAGVQLGHELVAAQRQLQSVLGESIDNLFTGQVRAEFERHIEQAAQHLIAGDSTAAKDQAEAAVQALLSDIVDTLQSHWSELLRLLLGIVSKALEEALAAHMREAFASITSFAGHEMEEKANAVEEKLAEKLEDLREHLLEARDTIHERVDEAREQLQERVGEAGGSVNGGPQRGSKFGQPPSRRPPRGPSGQRGPGKPPRGLPPSISR